MRVDGVKAPQDAEIAPFFFVHFTSPSSIK